MRARRSGRGAGRAVRDEGERAARRRCATLPPAWARRPAGLDAGAARARSRRCVDARLGRRGRSRPTIRSARCACSRPTRVKVVVIGQDPYPTPATPTGWRFRPARAGRARCAASSRCWPRDRPALRRARRLAARRLGAPGRAAAQPGADGRGRSRRQPHGLRLAGAHSRNRPGAGSPSLTPPVFLLWGAQGAGRSVPTPRRPAPAAASCDRATLRYDFERAFMADGSHFDATVRPASTGGRSDRRLQARAIVPGSSRRGARVAKGGRL